MRLGGQIVNLIRADSGDHSGEIRGVQQVTIMKINLVVDVIDTRSVERGGTTDNTVDVVAFLEEESDCFLFFGGIILGLIFLIV